MFMGNAPLFLAQVVHLPRLQHIVQRVRNQPFQCGDRLQLPGLPTDMGPLCSSLLHLDVSGHALTHFPLALTQLAALQCLRADRNEFVQLPTAITALSRLTELTLGRITPYEDRLQLHVRRPLDVRALGDLSGFPPLRVLTFGCCEVFVCQSILNAVQRTSLPSISFQLAHPAPVCALTVLLLANWLGGQGRISVLRFVWEADSGVQRAVQEAQGRAPFQKFVTALEACGM